MHVGNDFAQSVCAGGTLFQPGAFCLLVFLAKFLLFNLTYASNLEAQTHYLTPLAGR